MQWALTVVQPPAAEPVSLAEAKAHLRVDDDSQDAYIAALITAAREWCEQFQGRAYITQKLRLHLETWPSGRRILLPRPPLVSVESVSYRNDEGQTIVFDPSAYRVDTASEPGAIVLAPDRYWPGEMLDEGMPITIDFTAGYGADATSVPQRVRQAVLLYVGFLFENRGDSLGQVGLPKAVRDAIEALLWPDRAWYPGPEG